MPDEEKDEARGEEIATLSYRLLARVNFGDFLRKSSFFEDFPLLFLIRVPNGLPGWAGESKQSWKSGLLMKDWSNPCNSIGDSQTRRPQVD